MESADKGLLRVLLGRLRELGLISQATYLGAMDLVGSQPEDQEFLLCPAPLREEETTNQHSKNPK